MCCLTNNEKARETVYMQFLEVNFFGPDLLEEPHCPLTFKFPKGGGGGGEFRQPDHSNFGGSCPDHAAAYAAETVTVNH